MEHGMTKSRFDPLDMALGTLTATTGPAEKESRAPLREEPLGLPSTSPPASSRREQPSVPSNIGGRSHRTAPSTRKTQLNVYVRAETADELRQAVLQLGQRHSLGDLVSRLVDDHLDDVVERLAIEDTEAT